MCNLYYIGIKYSLTLISLSKLNNIKQNDDPLNQVSRLLSALGNNFGGSWKTGARRLLPQHKENYAESNKKQERKHSQQ